MSKVDLYKHIKENKLLSPKQPWKGPRNAWYFDVEIYFNHKLTFFKKANILLDDVREVIDNAQKLSNFMDEKKNIAKFNDLNIEGNSSSKIQDIIIDFCKELGFESEKKGLFKNYNLRPDYYKKLNNGGILLEVERGKTITNNMDLYDLWKCHICEEANHLFLFVPQHVSHTKNIYESSKRRLRSFFDAGFNKNLKQDNTINVDSLFLFGY